VHASGESVVVGGISHLVVQIESLADVSAALAQQGIDVDAVTVHDLASGFVTAWLDDPDGYRIELVQWGAGHPQGMTAEDFAG